MSSTLYPNFLIGLREGLEAALVVSILVTFLVRSERRDRLPLVWLGVGAAVGLSVAAGWSLMEIWENVDSFYAQELMGGVLSIVAVAFVTWMIFWMRRMARFIKKDLHNKLATALAIGPFAIAVASFLAVAREGLETALIFWSSQNSAGDSTVPLVGTFLGIAVSVVLGWLIYRSAVKINLSKFFTYTGVGLIFVAAGILAYGVHDLQEIEILPGLSSKAFDISGVYDASSWYGTLLKGLFNFQPDPSVLQSLVWLGYITVVLTAFLWPGKNSKPTQPASKPAQENQEPAEQELPVPAQASVAEKAPLSELAESPSK